MIPVRNQYGKTFYQPSDGRQGAYAPQPNRGTSYNVPVPRVNPMNQLVTPDGKSYAQPGMMPRPPRPWGNYNAERQYQMDVFNNMPESQRQTILGGGGGGGVQNPQGGPITLAQYAQNQAGNVQNPFQKMMGGVPAMSGSMSGGDLASAMGLGDRFKQLAGQRNVAGLNNWMATEPIQAQMQRMGLAANVGTDQMGLVNQGEQLNDQYNFLNQQRRLAAARSIYG